MNEKNMLTDMTGILELFSREEVRSQPFICRLGEREVSALFHSLRPGFLVFTEFEPFYANSMVNSERPLEFFQEVMSEDSMSSCRFLATYRAEINSGGQWYYLFSLPDEVEVEHKPLCITFSLGNRISFSFKMGLQTHTYNAISLSYDEIYFKASPAEFLNNVGYVFSLTIMFGQASVTTKARLQYNQDTHLFYWTDYIDNRKVEKQIDELFSRFRSRAYQTDENVVKTTPGGIMAFSQNSSGRRAIAKALATLAVSVVVSDGYAVAAELCERFSPRLLVIDTDVPYLSGWNLHTPVRTMNVPKDMPVILVSGLIQASLPAHLLEAANFVLSKPLIGSMLLKHAQEILQEG